MTENFKRMSIEHLTWLVAFSVASHEPKSIRGRPTFNTAGGVDASAGALALEFRRWRTRTVIPAVISELP